ncbi:hypothetical protein C7271_24595 [filamentous cyanobacterium CCP5]|nr:hypothetical protein C7271_24595 [filamentous cyanobacterium CCP5]
MSPNLLRQLWSLVEASQSSTLLSLDDNRLVKWLLEQMTGNQAMNPSEADNLSSYIESKLSLIRDLAQSRG